MPNNNDHKLVIVMYTTPLKLSDRIDRINGIIFMHILPGKILALNHWQLESFLVDFNEFQIKIFFFPFFSNNYEELYFSVVLKNSQINEKSKMNENCFYPCKSHCRYLCSFLIVDIKIYSNRLL